MLWANPCRYSPCVAILTLLRVKPPFGLWKAPMATATSGAPRPSAMYTPNGTTPAIRRSPRAAATAAPGPPGAPESERNSGASAATSSSILSRSDAGPLRQDDLRGGRLLRLRRERQRRRRRRGQRLVRGLVDRVAAEQRGQFDRPGLAREPQVLARGRVEVLLPQPGRGRVRRGLADGLVVVGGVVAVRRDHDLEPRDARAGLGGQQVVPPDQDRRLAAVHGGRAGRDRDEVADLVQLLEVGHARRDVAERAAVGQRGGVDRREGGARLRRVAVDRDLVLVRRLEQVGERGRRGGDLRRVVADGHVPAVVGVVGPVAGL